MSDYRTGSIEEKKDSVLEKPFFTCLKPYLDFLAKGTLFNLIYFVMAGINLILPFAFFAAAVNLGVFRGDGNYALAFIFTWVVIALLCWFGIQLWLDRRKKIIALRSTEFIATIVFSDIVQTFGEWLGTFIAVTGAVVGLIATVILDKNSYLFSIIGLVFMQDLGALVILAGPVAGSFIIILFRLFAEGIRLWVSLVNNTHEIALNNHEIAVNIKSAANVPVNTPAAAPASVPPPVQARSSAAGRNSAPTNAPAVASASAPLPRPLRPSFPAGPKGRSV